MVTYLFDDEKRSVVLKEHGLDLAQARQAFDGFYLSRRDNKHSGDEERFHTIGTLSDGTVVIVVWTWRRRSRRIITMWKANERERLRYGEQRDRGG